MVGSILSVLADLHVVLFVGFFSMSAVAIYLRDREKVRKGFMAVFLLLLVTQGLVVTPGWPFNGWTLFGQEAPHEEIRYEYRVADAEGNELLYDTRATGVLITPVMHRYGQKSTTGYWGETFTTSERDRFGRYLLVEAQKYRQRVERGQYDEAWEFPRHQLDYRWTPARLEAYGAFVELRLYRVTIRLSEHGRQVDTEAELINRVAVATTERTAE